jgi:hypothetical protein
LDKLYLLFAAGLLAQTVPGAALTLMKNNLIIL